MEVEPTMLNQGTDVSKQDAGKEDNNRQDDNPLYEVIRTKNIPEIQRLLKDPKICSTAHEQKNYVVRMAARCKLWGVVIQLLKIPAILATIENTDTELFYAKGVHRCAIFAVLMENKVLFEKAAWGENYLLACATEDNDIRLVKKLLTNQEVADKLAFRNNWILRVISDRRHDELIWLLTTTPRSTLCDSGYNKLMVAIVGARYSEALELIDQCSEQQLNQASDFGFTALMLAAARFASMEVDVDNWDILKIIQQLLSRGVDITRTTRHTSFAYIADKSGLLENEGVMQALVMAQNTFEIRHLYNGRNILHIFLQYGDQTTTRLFNYLRNNYGLLSALINQLDYCGNSPLSYALLAPGFKHNPEILMAYVKQGAKFIRNNQECRTALHMAVLCEQVDLSNVDPSEINIPDENAYTVLHYACILGDQKLAQDLQAQGASLYSIDKFGRSPLHYAAFKGLNLLHINSEMMLVEDVFGICPAVYARRNQEFDVLTDGSKLSYKQKLAKLSSFKYTDSIFNAGYHNPEDFDNAAKSIIDTEFSDPEKYPTFEFPDGWALGIELEIAELPEVTFIPLEDFNTWFSLKLVSDMSVRNSTLSLYPMDPHGETPCEYNSQIINSSSKYYSFLAACDVLRLSGAKVNQTCAMHLHVNVNGTAEDLNAIVPCLIAEEQKIIFLKYLFMNYISIEMLLRGFMRGGGGFNQNDDFYDVLISEAVQKLDACESMESLYTLLVPHTVSLNFSSLETHGTVEFRLHEGTIDPILIHAWVDCITRLVAISLAQAKAHRDGRVIAAKEDIEQLVYLFITNRSYKKTWDPLWGASQSANVPSAMPYLGHDKSAYQLQIMQAPIYNMMTIILESSAVDLESKLNDYIEAEQQHNISIDLQELAKLVSFCCDNPGLFPSKIDRTKTLQIIRGLIPVKKQRLTA
jgi:hypothetical protein